MPAVPRGIPYEDREKLLFDLAVRKDVFTIEELWTTNRWIHYGEVSRTLLKWWHEGMTQRWSKSHEEWYHFLPNAKVKPLVFPGKATYRWTEEEVNDATSGA